MSMLTYLVCVSTEEGEGASAMYTDMCNICVESINKFGEYNGEIVVITDNPQAIDAECKICPITKHRVSSARETVLLRHQLRDIITTKKYDSILYLDNDIVVTGDIEEIHSMVDENIAFAEEFPYNLYNTSYPTQYISREMRIQNKSRPRTSTGTFCMDATNNTLYRDIEHRIEDFVRSFSSTHKYQGVNQLPVCIMIMKGSLPYSAIPHTWTEFPIAALDNGMSMTNLDKVKVFHLSSGHVSQETQLDFMQKIFRAKENNNIEKLNDILSKQDIMEKSDKWFDRRNINKEDVAEVNIADCVARFYRKTETEKGRIRMVQGESDIITHMVNNIEDGDIIYDIGANVGTHTLLLANSFPESVVVAFEPEENNFERLQENMKINNAENVMSVKRAVFDEETTLQMSKEGDEAGHGHHYISDDGNMEIDTIAEDGIRERLISEPDVIKVDVEGAELRALLGLGSLLDNVKHLYVEVHPERMKNRYGDDDDELLALLELREFTVGVLQERGSEYFVYAHNPEPG